MHPLYLRPTRLVLATVLLLLLALPSFAQPAKPFKLQLDNYRGSIQWEQSADHLTWSPVPKGAVAKLSLDPKQTTYYRARVTESGCSPVYSDIKAAYIYGDLRLSAKLIQGKVVLPANATLKATDCTIMSFLEKRKLQADGSFELLAPDSTAEQLLILTNPAQQVLMVGTFFGEAPSYELSAESTSLALLMMYPWLKPITPSQKLALIPLYQKEPEFARLRGQVEALIKQGGNLYAETNLDIARSVVALMGKSFNNSRRRPTGDLPLTIDEVGTGTSIIVENATTHSYAVGIYQKAGSKESRLKSFTVAGSTLEESPWKALMPIDRNTQTQVAYDFANADQGEYVIKVRTGFAMDGSPEDEDARGTNARDLLISAVDNILLNAIPLGSSPILTKCFKGMFESGVGLLKTELKDNIRQDENQQTNLLTEILCPVIVDLNSGFLTCATQNSQDYLSLAFSSVNILKKVLDAKPTLDFAYDWMINEASITDCKFIFTKDKQTRMVNCFTMQAYLAPGEEKLPPKMYVCEEVTAKVQLLEDVQYYPYFKSDAPDDGSWVPGVEVFWSAKGGGTLSLGVEAKLTGGRITTTDGLGVATVKWKVSDQAGKQDLAAQIYNANFTVLKQVDFNTMAMMPVPKVVPSGDKQPGSPGQTLPNPITILMRDGNNLLPMSPKLFDLKWEVVKGGGSLFVDPRVDETFGRAWKLGPDAGEQQVKVTIVNKDCTPWVIEGNPYYFTALNKNPWIDTLVGKNWKYEAFIQYSDYDYKRLVDTYEASKDQNPCGFTWIPQGNNTVRWFGSSKHTFNFTKDMKYTIALEVNKASNDCSLMYFTYNGFWQVTSDGYVTTNERSVPLNGQIEKIDANTYRVSPKTPNDFDGSIKPVKVYYILTRL